MISGLLTTPLHKTLSVNAANSLCGYYCYVAIHDLCNCVTTEVVAVECFADGGGYWYVFSRFFGGAFIKKQ